MTIETRPTTLPAVSVPAEKSVADVLRHAALIIEERGWQQDELGELAGPYCAWGGIAVASGGDLTQSESIEVEEAALNYLSARLGTDIPSWNDAPGRTASEVTAALRAAADAWERDR